jgi:hypothetical protein
VSSRQRAWRRLAATSALIAFVLSFSWRARAGPPDLTVQVDAEIVGQGDQVRLMLQAMSDEGSPNSPSPGNTPGFTVMSSSSGQQSSTSWINGRVTQKQGLSTTWVLRADRQGTFTLGPPSIGIGGLRVAGNTVRVTVVAPGRAPQRANPMDPFGMGLSFDPFRGFFGGAAQIVEPPRIPTDPKLALDAPRGNFAFLHAVVDKTSAVVGEQVTLLVYVYIDANEHEADLNDVHEATADDFVKRSLLEDDNADKTVGRALVGGRLFGVKLIRKWALFPLKTGDLEIGPMSLALSRKRSALADPLRESERIVIHAVEPPLSGRPPGYIVGDTGNFALAATTTPRDIERDSAVGVTVDLSGTGNLPASITPPARAGIEWLAPEIHEKLGATSGDRYGGKRTFAFVVRLHKEGMVDLGDFTLPYYNPETRSYGVARAALGVVNVRPGTAPASVADVAFDPFAALPAARSHLSPGRMEPVHLADTPLFWLGLAATPVAYVVASGTRALFRRAQRARSARARSPERDLQTRMAAATVACRGNDPRAADAAVTRVLHAATVAKVGVNVRDAEGAEVSRRLAGAGVEEDVARQIEELIHNCESARFAPEAAEMAAVRERWEAARTVVGSLKRGP